MLGTQSR
jgi:transposase